MATKAMKMWGTVVKFNGYSVGEVKGLNGGDRTREFIKIFTFDSPDETAEFITSGITPGQVTIDVVYDGETAGLDSKLETDFIAGTKATFEITYKNGSKKSMDAIVAGKPLPSGEAEGGVAMHSIPFQLSGVLTTTYPSA
jgi:hypothetical protein